MRYFLIQSKSVLLFKWFYFDQIIKLKLFARPIHVLIIGHLCVMRIYDNIHSFVHAITISTNTFQRKIIN